MLACCASSTRPVFYDCAQLVIDLRSLSLPDSIEAFFVLSISDDNERQFVTDMHSRFLQEYPKRHTPLLQLDLEGGGQAPFS